MGSKRTGKDIILRYLIEKSLFTEAQLSIILTRLRGERIEGRSRGAYYRLLKQSRDKVEGILFSILLLEMIEFINEEKNAALDRLSKQLRILISSDIDEITARDVIRIMEEVMRRIKSI